MKKMKTACLALSSLFVFLSSGVNAHDAGLTRQQVISETEAFLAIHEWDSLNSVWTVKPGFDLPAELPARESARSLMEQFLGAHQWDESQGAWAPIKGEPRHIAQVRSDQRQFEIDRFMLTHRYEAGAKRWIKRSRTAA